MGIVWPSSLPERPGLPQRDEREESRLRSDLGQLASDMRNRFTAVPRTVACPMIMTGTERAAFDSFYADTLDDGAQRFQWVDPIDDSAVQYRFVSPPSWRMVRGDAAPANRLWQATFEMEIMPGAFAIVESATLALTGTATFAASATVV